MPEQKDFAQVAEKMAPEIRAKAVAKMGGQQFRIAVFPFGDSDGKVTISMHEPNTVLQGELIANLIKLAEGKYVVLDKPGLKKEFKAAGIDAAGIASNDPKNTAEIIKKIGVDVAVVGSLDAKSAAQVQQDNLKKINIALTIIYQDGTADQIAGDGPPSDIKPPETKPSGRFAVQLFLTGNGEKEIPLITSKNPDSEYHNVFFAELPDNLPFGTDAASYKIRIANAGEPTVDFKNPSREKERIFAVAVTLDGVNSIYQDQGNGTVVPVVVHARNAKKWILSGPGQKLVPDASQANGYHLESVSNVGHSVVDIPGFQKDRDTAEKFLFANPRESIAETVGITNDIGVITVHFYPEDMDGDIEHRSRGVDLGTKPGAPVNNPIFAVKPKLKSNPVEVWRIFYRKKGDCPVKPEERIPVF